VTFSSARGLGRKLAADAYAPLSMKIVIEKLQEERLQGSEFKGNSILSLKQRRIIAVLLSHTLLQFCGSAWLSEHWDKGSISFLQHSCGDRLVLSTDLQVHQIGPDLDAPDRFHQYPGILALGIILLEMELRKTIETARSEQDEEPNPNTNVDVALKMFDDIQDNAMPDFKAAVEACLINFDCIQESREDKDDIIYHRDKLYDSMALRNKIYQEIIVPLERELCTSFPEIKLEKLSQMPLTLSFWGRKDFSPQNRRIVPISPTPLPNLRSKANSVMNSILPPDQKAHIPCTQPIFFHDVSVASSIERQVTLICFGLTSRA
jgi:hypothetical protein